MELKIKYQSSYFIYPFIIKEEKYEKYIMKMLKDKNIELKIFNKMKDTDIYNYFLPEVLKFGFCSFGLYEDERKKMEELNPKLKSKIIAEYPCITFEYKLDNNIQAKTGQEGGVFFDIQKIQIICFNTGECFIIIKTNLEETNKFDDLLDFNYKFREVNSDTFKLKAYENIKIQTNTFGDTKKLSDLIKEVTGNMQETKKANIDVNKFLTYSYVCLEQECWNNENNYEKIEKDFLKYANILPSTFNSKFENDKMNIINMGEYIKIGVTKTGFTLLTSSVNPINYTKLPTNMENQFLYTYIIVLYKRIYLKNILKKYRNEKDIIKIKNNFTEFTENIWTLDLTNDDNGRLIEKNLNEILELDELYETAKKQYDIKYKELNIEKNQKINKVLLLLLLISLGFNILDFYILIKKIIEG